MKQTGERSKNASITQPMAHLAVILLYTVFSILLVAATLLQPWEKWPVPVILLSVGAVWTVYIGQFWKEDQQILFYTALMLLEFFNYGAHQGTFSSLSVIICLLIMALLAFRKMLLLYIAAGTYGVTVLYHICFLGTFTSADGLSVTRLCLNIVSVIICVLFARLLLEQQLLERKRTEQGLKMMEAANSRSEDFIANVSHELRTPINVVTGVSDILLQQELSSDMRKNMVSIQQAGRRLAIQINNILDYTDLIANRLSTSNEDYLISSSINDMIVMAAAQNADRKLEIVFDVEPGLPSVLIGDEAKIRRVMSIIIENAIKFTETGGVYVYIGYRKAAYGINLNIQIHDTGIGMNTAQLSNVYQHFYQADSGRGRRTGGLGLGLPIASGLTHAMGGFMNITSKPGNGTQVRLCIPQGVADEGSCMTLCSPSPVNCVCCFGLEGYSGEVREYYRWMLKSIEKEFGFHIVHQLSEFDELLRTSLPTHIFVTQEVYAANPTRYDELGKESFVTVIAEAGFEFPQECGPLFLLHKPFCALSIVNILNESRYHANPNRSVSQSEGISCRGVKVLVVDDDQMNLLVAKGIFCSYGMETDVCLGGEAALEQCQKTEYDAVFLDHMMPGMDGVETLKHLRALESGIYQNIPIVALTANAVSGAREMFKAEGFDEFVAKPIERSVLERVLRRILPGKWKWVRTGEKQEVSVSEDSAETPVIPEVPDETENEPETAPAPLETPETPAGPADSPLTVLSEQGFDVKAGISYCGGSEEFYIEMLQNFQTSSAAKQAEIVSFHEAGDWENYTIKVHALKTNARTIGAAALSDCAAALEQAGKNTDTAYIEENHQKLMELYETCCAQIGKYTGVSAAEAVQDAAEVSEDAWQTAMTDLSAALKAFNGFQAESVIKELSACARHGRPCGELFQTLMGYVDDFDFEAAESELFRLMEEDML